MSTTEIEDTLNELAEKVMMVEVDDLPTLGEIHGLLEDLHKASEESSLIYAKDVAEDLQRVTDVMLMDSNSPEDDLELLRCGVQFWQKGKAREKKRTGKKKENQQIKAEQPEDDAFTEKLKDSVSRLEELSLELEKEDNSDSVEEVLRLIHTLKGESGVLGLDELNILCHETESALQNGSIEDGPQRTLAFLDWIKVKYLGIDTEALDYDAVLGVIKNGMGAEEEASEQEEDEPTETIINQDPSFYTDFGGEADEHIETAEQILLESSEDEVSDDDINTIFRSFHTIKGVSGFLDLHDLQVLTHRAENVFDKIRSKKMKMNGELHDLCFKVLDKVKHLIHLMKECVKEGKPIPRDPEVKTYVIALDRVLEGGDAPADEKKDTGPSIPAPTESVRKAKEASSVKVATERLDQVINLVGELVTSNAMVSQELQGQHSKTLMANLNHMKKNVNELQALAMSLRMVPIKNTFLKMSRIIRDLSKKMGKQIEFTMAGEDTELDRNMVDLLGDPLVHMVRNSADHGVESPEEREASGKDPMGHVELSAYHKGGNIVIQIKDDGKGIDRDVIYGKAVEKGLIHANQEMSDSEVFGLIFAPGFSTAQAVTDVSGRGVGMDVVRKNIENLRGRIEIESEKGKGTTFLIHLPLTLAIIDGMVIRVADQRYIVPTVSIHQTFSTHDQGLHSIQEKGRVLKFRDHLVPVLNFEEIFGDPDCKGEGTILMVLGAGEKNVAILVDEIVTQQEVVIKSLHETMKNIKGLSGSAILPDGTVGLILDPVEIASLLKEGATI